MVKVTAVPTGPCEGSAVNSMVRPPSEPVADAVLGSVTGGTVVEAGVVLGADVVVDGVLAVVGVTPVPDDVVAVEVGESDVVESDVVDVAVDLLVVVRPAVALLRFGPVLHADSTKISASRQAARRTSASYWALADAWFDFAPVPTLLVAATS
jgi:hypothetical protein